MHAEKFRGMAQLPSWNIQCLQKIIGNEGHDQFLADVNAEDREDLINRINFKICRQQES